MTAPDRTVGGFFVIAWGLKTARSTKNLSQNLFLPLLLQ